MSNELSQCKRVVVYRIGSLGDTLVALPAFHLVRRIFPQARITLLTNVPVNARAAPMESILEHTNLYNDILRYPTSLRGVSKLLALRKTLAAGRYDCLIYLTEPKGGIPTSIRDHVFFRLCGIPRIIGIPYSAHTLRPMRVPGSELFTSETARVLECIGELGHADAKDPRNWDLQLTDGEIGNAEAVLRNHGISGGFLALSVGTKFQCNDWEEPNWTLLIERLAAEFPGLPLIAFGAREEWERCAQLLKIWKGPKANLCGMTSPRVSAAILRSAAVMVCHDSGPMHLAATVGVPCVAIFSGRNPPGVWYPHGDQHTILYHRTPCWGCKLTVCIEEKKACILSIPVEAVHAAVRSQLARRGFFPEANSTNPVETQRPENRVCAPVAMPNLGENRRAPEVALGKSVGRQSPAMLNVLLIANYEPDGQQSMQRFAAIMEAELAARGVGVSLIRPEPFFGRLRPGADGLGKWLGYLDKFLIFPIRLKRQIRRLGEAGNKAFVVHVCDHSNAFYTRHLRDVPHVVTCHDLLAIRSALGEIPQNPTRWSGRILQRLVLRGLEGARAIACDSDATHRDVLRLVKGAAAHSWVTKIGLNAPFRPVPNDEARARTLARMGELGMRFPKDGKFIVHVGGDQWYKNRGGVVEIFGELHRMPDQADLWLLMVGKPLNPALKSLIESAGLGNRVVELPGVSHEDLCAIYSAAELLLFPSLQEGFGWPVIEAQACGCRVVTTDRPPMNDIGGDAAAYLNPEDAVTSSEVLLRILGEDERLRRLRVERGLANAAKYSTAEMIAGYLALYERMLG